MSKLNPQKASAYVGPGVLKQGGNITPVPNGPLIKKKGPFKGSTLKTGGVIKKAQTGVNLTPQQKRAQLDSITAIKRADITRKKDSILDRNAAAQGLTREQVRAKQEADKKKPDATSSSLSGQNAGPDGCKAIGKAARARGKNGLTLKAGGVVKKAQTGGTYYASSKGRVGRLSGSSIGDNISSIKNESIDTTGYSKGKKEFIKTKKTTFEKPSSERVKREDVPKVISKLKKGATKKMDLRTLDQRKKSKMKSGGMIKRADGSTSKRGLWDNIRANKGSGKKPTNQMLVQEKKIKSKK